MTCVTLSAAKVFWSSIMSDKQWKKNMLCSQYFIINEVKQLFKILHRIYPVKEVMERFKLNLDYSCVFFNSEKETIIHLFFHCEHTKLFRRNMNAFINEKMCTNVQFNLSCIMLYFVYNSTAYNSW